MMKKRRQLPPRLSLSAGFTWMGRVIYKGRAERVEEKLALQTVISVTKAMKQRVKCAIPDRGTDESS